MEDKIHFKITHAGETRRFALSRGEADLLSTLRVNVANIIGNSDAKLYWKDQDSQIVLDSAEDLSVAIDYAESQNKLACIVLDTGVEKGSTKIGKVVTEKREQDHFQWPRISLRYM
ncbi:hypothetical protein PENTCL1PPCAC_1710 [Pristionchus entomophagus]|uniref:PB1 domain-containing protein n=1 Tax=Pristionchus entomophagus TaxID=358040 RepID=A0AAV5S9Y8_9BILA|nr:hypothetical protein PENTCL1PPCAC_1710 [Pristionchus entomophagus]